MLGFIILLSFSVGASLALAGNPSAPIDAADNIQDPTAPSTPWGGCTPSDSNCYITTHWATDNGVDIYYSGGKIGMGASASLKSRLHIVGSTTASGADAIGGTYESLTLTNSTASGSQFGDRIEITVNGTVAGSEIGNFIKITDSTSLANTVRGIEIQSFSGTNTAGVNTGLAAFAKTFGVHAVTTSEAGGVSIPAALFADLDSSAAPTSGNAIRAYTNDATAANLVSFYQETSAFSGTGLVMNFGNNSGSFTGNFLDLQEAGSSRLTVDDTGRVDILAVDADNIIPLYINSEESTSTQTVFAIESDTTNNSQSVDTVKAHFEADGKLYVSLTGTQNAVALCHATNGQTNNDQIVDCSGAPADIAEWYETTSDVEPGDVVAVSSDRVEFDYASGIGKVVDEYGNSYDEVPLAGYLASMAVLERAEVGQTVLGVVSTSPYQTFGEDVLVNSVHPERIALTGRVPVKVTEENGPIRAGDRLTLSVTTRGYAMKMTYSGESIGIALEDSDEAKDKILMFVNLGYQRFEIEPDVDVWEINVPNTPESNEDSPLSNWKIDDSGNLIVEIITVEKGINLKDQATGGYYCLTVVNGELEKTQGKCGENEENDAPEEISTPEPEASENLNSEIPDTTIDTTEESPLPAEPEEEATTPEVPTEAEETGETPTEEPATDETNEAPAEEPAPSPESNE